MDSDLFDFSATARLLQYALIVMKRINKCSLSYFSKNNLEDNNRPEQNGKRSTREKKKTLLSLCLVFVLFDHWWQH